MSNWRARGAGLAEMVCFVRTRGALVTLRVVITGYPGLASTLLCVLPVMLLSQAPLLSHPISRLQLPPSPARRS